MYAPIWTTTPWSLPCNKAIAFNPNLNYTVLSLNDNQAYLIENELAEHVKKTVPLLSEATRVENCIISGHLLANSFYKSIFSENPASHLPLLAADYVGSKQGTGLVHTAPALGQDDFKLAIRNNLPIHCVIDELGRYTHDDVILNRFGLNGLVALDADTTSKIKEALDKSIMHVHTYVHSYPYDWRTKKPVIIRSSMQWFIDTNKLKGWRIY